jgi:oligopeptide/dipeptide ABC transporter ATP-binding protein
MGILEVKDLKVYYRRRESVTTAGRKELRAVDGVSFSVENGESVGLVGESGCGKTTIARAIERLIPVTDGRILIDGQDVTALGGETLRRLRKNFQMVFQDPFGSLDPRMTVEEIVTEALNAHDYGLNDGSRQSRILTLLQAVGLSGSHLSRRPSELSGGQRQRVGIARSLAVEPKLLICDEPVASLDVTIQAQVINLLIDIQRERGLAYLFISHDLAVVERICRRILVMYLGKIVESGDTNMVVRSPAHPYTQALVKAVPKMAPRRMRPVAAAPVETLPAGTMSSGCPYQGKCPIAQSRCQMEAPALREIAPNHFASCHFA